MTVEHASADLSFSDGQWVVTVREDDRETRREFQIKEHAENWQAGQRVRLGLSNLLSGKRLQDPCNPA